MKTGIEHIVWSCQLCTMHGRKVEEALLTAPFDPATAVPKLVLWQRSMWGGPYSKSVNDISKWRTPRWTNLRSVTFQITRSVPHTLSRASEVVIYDILPLS